MKTILMTLAGIVAMGALSSCDCDCNRPNPDYLYGSPSSSRSF